MSDGGGGGGDGGGRHPLDGVVEAFATLVEALGGNGGRVRWKWHRYRAASAERAAQREVSWRGATGRHKMYPACRALVGKNERRCPDCGEPLQGVQAPGLGRTLANAFPGMTSMTALLLLVNGFWFVLMLIKQGQLGGGGGLFGGFDSELLVRFGAGLSQPRLLSDGLVTGGEWWRLVTPVFLHGGLLHFGLNSYILMQIGPLVEEIYGTPRAWVIYLAAGVSGNLLSQLPRFTLTVGASTALLGIVGVLFVHGWRTGNSALRSAMFRYLILIGIFGLVFIGRIDNLGHLGGAAGGALMGLIVPPRSSRRDLSEGLWQVAALLGVVVVLASFFFVSTVSAGR